MTARILLPLLVILAIAGLWQAGHVLIGQPELLPSLGSVFGAIAAEPGFFLHHTLLTMFEAATGLVIAIVFGFLLSIVLVRWSPARTALLPLIIAAQSIPLVAIAPILVLGLGDGMATKIIMASMLCWFPTVMNALRGMTEIDPFHLSIFRSYGASEGTIIRKLRIPNSFPFLASGIRISAGLALIGAVVAEYSGGDQGLGSIVIFRSIVEPDAPILFATVICSAIAGVALAETANAIAQALLRRQLLRP